MSSISIQIQNKKKPSQLSTLAHKCHFRAVGKSENPEVPVLFGGHNLPTLVEIGLTDLTKSGGALVPPAPPGTTGLHFKHHAPFCAQDDRKKMLPFTQFCHFSLQIIFTHIWLTNVVKNSVMVQRFL